VAQALAIALNALSLAIISRRLGDADLGAYTLERRTMSLLQPLVLVGLTVATPLFIALRRGEGDVRHGEFATAGVVLVALFASAAATVMLVFPGPIAALAFGDPAAVGLARALAGFVLAMALYQGVYAVLRGYLQVGPANLLELTVVGMLPVATAWLGPHDVVSIMWWLNAGILLAALVWGVFALRGRLRHIVAAVRARSGTMLRYGLARTPGDLAVVGLFSLAPIVVVHFADARQAGYTSIVQSSLNLVAISAVPLGVLLLPRVALERGLGEGDLNPARYVMMAAATIDLSLGLCALLVIASPLVMSVWLPALPDGVVLAQQVAALGIPGYFFYLVFRSYLDAVHSRPYSSVATIMGLGLMALTLPAALLLVEPASVGASIPVAFGLTCVGVVTWRFTARSLPGLADQRPSLALLAWFACVLTAGLLLPSTHLWTIAGTIVAATTFLALLAIRRPPWFRKLLSRPPSALGASRT
jgi:O-antigen/teichoic acid export membrane protein